MKNDALDVVLKKITDEEDWQVLLEICDCKATIKLEELTNTGRALAFNKEIRSNYGNNFVNIFRDEYSPDYSDILKATAEKLSIENIPDYLTDYDIEVLEYNIIVKILKMVKKQIIKARGFAAWDEIEKEAVDNIDKIYAAGKITSEYYTRLKNIAASSSIMEEIIAGKVSGFVLYVIINQIFFAISRYLGLGIDVRIGWPIFTLLYSPLYPFLTDIYANRDKNWKKTILTVVFIAVMRQKLKYNINL